MRIKLLAASKNAINFRKNRKGGQRVFKCVNAEASSGLKIKVIKKIRFQRKMNMIMKC